MFKKAASCLLTLSILLAAAPAQTQEKGGKKVPDVLQFKMKSLNDKTVDLAKYQGKVILMVNVASQCGYTPQYKALQALHAKYAKDGLAILGFPCNDYGNQEPGTEAEIADFCQKNYGVTFDMFAKVVINGKDPCPLYRFLTSKETNPKFAGRVRWNFEKFLIARDGTIVARYQSSVNPESKEFVSAIQKQLEKK